MNWLKAYLYRFQQAEKGILGVLVADRYDGSEVQRVIVACTFELPLPGGRFIPAGTHLCRRVEHPHKLKTTFAVLDIPGLEPVLFREGNIKLRQARGCILLGKN